MGLKDLLAVVLLVVCGVTWYLYRRHITAAFRRKMNKARRSRLKTVELLEERGFRIIDCDQTVEVTSFIDQKSYTDSLTVDFVVQKGPERYLVRTTSGAQSSKLGYRENREPLMAVSAIFCNPNILLVDPERRNIRLMKTSSKKGLPQRLKQLGKSVLIFLLGAFCAIIIRYLVV